MSSNYKYINLIIIIFTLVSCNKKIHKELNVTAGSISLDQKIIPNVIAICNEVKNINFPPADIPNSAEIDTLKECNSYNSYYGIKNNAIDYIKAKKCAFAELKNNYSGTFINGNITLLNLYANGFGVKKDLALAINLACKQISTTGYLEEGQKEDITYWIQKLYQSKMNNSTEKFDVCAHFVSSFNYKTDCQILAFDNKCKSLANINYPSSDLPTNQDTMELKGCDSNKLYYGIGVPIDYNNSRKCAFLQISSGEQEIFGGSAILMMIYANGFGVKRNIDLALKASCDIDGAPAEIASRYEHLITLKDDKFDLCSDVTSGYMQGFCADNSREISNVLRNQEINSIINKWPDADQKAFHKLIIARDNYFNDVSDYEVDLSGTARAALQIDAKNDLEEKFIKNLKSFEIGNIPNYTKQTFISSNTEINITYKKIMHGKIADDSGSTITIDGIAITQKSWMKYKDAWVRFATIHYPKVPNYIWQAWLTKERLDNLLTLDLVIN